MSRILHKLEGYEVLCRRDGEEVEGNGVGKMLGCWGPSVGHDCAASEINGGGQVCMHGGDPRRPEGGTPVLQLNLLHLLASASGLTLSNPTPKRWSHGVDQLSWCVLSLQIANMPKRI